MLKRIHNDFTPYMVRPLIYQAFTRLIFTLTLVLLWNELVNRSHTLRLSSAMIVTAVVYAVLAWMAYLRLDGMRVPRLDDKLFRRRHKHKDILPRGDMADYLEEEPVSFEELEKEEKDIILLLGNLIVTLLFLLISLFC